MTDPMRVVFFGTPEFAVPSLEALLRSGAEVPLVVTQPDRPVGRHGQPRPSPVAALGASRGIQVLRPERVRDNAELLGELRAARADAIVVVAYGRLLPLAILDLPPLACVNVHGSLLPKHRGASPVQAAILAGDRETGVATMKMEEALDAGPIYLERRTTIGEAETAAELSARLAELGAGLLVETLRDLAAGSLQARPQQGEPSYCRTIRREDGEADWSRDAEELSRRLRAFTPWPGLHTFLDAERIKILEAQPRPSRIEGLPGAFTVDDGMLVVAAGGGTGLAITRLQREGRKPVAGAEFARSVELPGRFGPSR
jgi:methionyl-tRNA formyltransferase